MRAQWRVDRRCEMNLKSGFGGIRRHKTFPLLSAWRRSRNYYKPIARNRYCYGVPDERVARRGGVDER